MSESVWTPPQSAVRELRRGWLLPAAATLGAFVALSLLCTILAYAFVLRDYYIPSGSMEPTLHVGTFVLADKLAYATKDPSRGDIVILREPARFAATIPTAGPEPKFVKRVVAVGGDSVSCCDEQHRLVLNGQGVTEPFTEGTMFPFQTVRVPEGSVFVLGDHRNMSVDSRIYGSVPTSSLIGRVIGPHGTVARLATFATGAYAGLLLTALGWVVLLLSRGGRTTA